MRPNECRKKGKGKKGIGRNGSGKEAIERAIYRIKGKRKVRQVEKGIGKKRQLLFVL
jgi:hypothetical protein